MINFWLCWVFVAARRLSLVVASGGYSRVVEHRLSNCGTWAQLPCSSGDLPGPGIEPAFPALAGSFLTSGPSGKSHSYVFEGLFWAKRLSTGNSFPNQLFLRFCGVFLFPLWGSCWGMVLPLLLRPQRLKSLPPNPKAINTGIQGSQT